MQIQRGWEHRWEIGAGIGWENDRGCDLGIASGNRHGIRSGERSVKAAKTGVTTLTAPQAKDTLDTGQQIPSGRRPGAKKRLLVYYITDRLL